MDKERPFGEPQSSEEPHNLELRRAHEHGRGRQASHPMQIPWRGWYDIIWRTYREIAGGVSFFILLAIFPAITALVSAYALFFNASTITNNLSSAVRLSYRRLQHRTRSGFNYASIES